MPLYREASDPLYVQLRDALQSDIEASVYQRYQRLPSERELSEKYGVSRMTARQALLALTNDGLVYRQARKGAFVAAPKIDQQVQWLSGFSEDVRARGGRPSSRVIEARCLDAPADVAAALRIRPGSSVTLLSRVRIADGSPLAVEAAYLPSELVPNLLHHDFSTQSLYERLACDYGLHLGRADQRIEAALANLRDVDLLELVPPAPVLRIQRLTCADNGQPVEWVISTYRGDRYAFRSVLTARASSGGDE